MIDYTAHNSRLILNCILILLFTAAFCWLVTFLIENFTPHYYGQPVPDATFFRLMQQEGINHPVKGVYTHGCADIDNLTSPFTGDKNGVEVNGVLCGGSYDKSHLQKAYIIRYF